MSERLSPSAESAAKPGENEDRLPGGTGFVFHEKYLDHTLGKGHLESPERLQAILRRMKASGLDRLVKNLRRGQVMNAFCALRPPGHHAADAGENGYCFYNNVAIAARYAQKKYKMNRVLIVDWDYHRGNGTEWAFYEDPSVLVFSTHERKAVPGTGFAERKGKGGGLGYNINVPLPPGADDRAILDAFESKMTPAAERFKPDLVLISAGFDSREGDLLGDFAVTDDGFAKLTRRMMTIAETHANSRLVSVLEGGYNIEGLALAVESHIRTLLGE